MAAYSRAVHGSFSGVSSAMALNSWTRSSRPFATFRSISNDIRNLIPPGGSADRGRGTAKMSPEPARNGRLREDGQQVPSSNPASARSPAGIIKRVTRTAVGSDDPNDDLPPDTDEARRVWALAKYEERTRREPKAVVAEAHRIVREAESIERAAKRKTPPPWRARRADREKH